MSYYTQLTLVQRYMIYRLLKFGCSQTFIAAVVGVCKSTISREVRRNTGGNGYRWRQAHALALARRQGKSKARITAAHWATVKAKLREQWSPEQISLWLAKMRVCRVSHEWIYLFIARDRKAGGKLYECLRIRKRGKKAYGAGSKRGKIQDATPIDARPAIVERRARIGDWEVDTIIGRAHKSALVSLTERKSRLTLLGKVSRKTAAEVGQVVVRLLRGAGRRVHTITSDNGLEFAGHKAIAQALRAKFYFAHPYASWERGANENANGLVRQYLPKGADFTAVTDAELAHIMQRLNSRPRKCLDMKTPNEVFFGKHRKSNGVAVGS